MCCIQQHPRQISSLRSLDYLVHWGWIPDTHETGEIPPTELSELLCQELKNVQVRVFWWFYLCTMLEWKWSRASSYSKLLLLARQLTVLKCGCNKTFYNWRETARVAASKRTKQKSILKKVCSLQSKSSHSYQKNCLGYFESLRWVVGRVWGWIETL